MGYIVVLCTARSRKSAVEVSKLVGASNFVISSNGAEIYDYINDKIIYINAINKKYYINIWNYCIKNNFKISLAIENDELVNEKFWDNQRQINTIFDIEDKDVKQCMIVSNDYEKTNALYKKIKEHKKLKSACNKVEQEYFGYWFNLLENGTSKGNAIKYLKTNLFNDNVEVISFGNDYNDISMFQNSNHSYAVYNCDNELKKYVNQIILSSDDDGVAKFIEDNYF